MCLSLWRGRNSFQKHQFFFSVRHSLISCSQDSWNFFGLSFVLAQLCICFWGISNCALFCIWPFVFWKLAWRLVETLSWSLLFEIVPPLLSSTNLHGIPIVRFAQVLDSFPASQLALTSKDLIYSREVRWFHTRKIQLIVLNQIDPSEVRSIVNRQTKNRISSRIVDIFNINEHGIHQGLPFWNLLLSSSPFLCWDHCTKCRVTSVGTQAVDFPVMMQERFSVSSRIKNCPGWRFNCNRCLRVPENDPMLTLIVDCLTKQFSSSPYIKKTIWTTLEMSPMSNLVEDPSSNSL